MAQEKLSEKRERLRNLRDQELLDELANERHKLYDLRSQNTTRQLENTAALAAAKKQIARILTLQRERELTAN